MAPMPNGATVFEISRRGDFWKKDIFENFGIPHKIKFTLQGIPKFSEMCYLEFPFHLACLLDFCMNGSLLEIEQFLVFLELFPEISLLFSLVPKHITHSYSNN